MVAIFTDLAEDVWFREGFAWDKPVILAIHQLSSPAMDTVMRILTQTGQGGAIVFTAILAIWFIRRKKQMSA